MNDNNEYKDAIKRRMQELLNTCANTRVRLAPDGTMHEIDRYQLDAKLAPFGWRVDETCAIDSPNAVLRLVRL